MGCILNDLQHDAGILTVYTGLSNWNIGWILREVQMEMLIVILIVGLAAGYVGYTFYKQFTGKSGCSSGCSCSEAMKNNCTVRHQSLDHLTFK